MPSLALLAAAALSAPQPGDIKSFGDWSVGCDNGWMCQAVSLVPEDQADSVAFARTVITVPPGPNPAIEIEIDIDPLPDGALMLAVDDRQAAPLERRDGALVVSGAAARAVVAAMVNGRKLALWRAGRPLAAVSLMGSSAMLRYIDAQQRRADTTAAFVARGTGATVPMPPALPRIVQMAPPARVIADPSGPAAFGLRRLAGCTDEVEGRSDPIHAFALDGRALLVLVPCGSGAYNGTFVPLITSGGTTDTARFDLSPGDDGAGRPLLINADWDGATGTLSSYYKGRGLGDCGVARSYVWDGTHFRLTQSREMTECRGAATWIINWRAAIDRK